MGWMHLILKVLIRFSKAYYGFIGECELPKINGIPIYQPCVMG
jgi:hypothetical protein